MSLLPLLALVVLIAPSEDAPLDGWRSERTYADFVLTFEARGPGHVDVRALGDARVRIDLDGLDREGDWRSHRIVATGGRVRYEQGERVVRDTVDDDPARPRSGRIEFSGIDSAHVRSIDVEPLPRFDRPGEAEWIWKDGDPEFHASCVAQRRFELPIRVRMARLMISCDNVFTARLNGEEIASGSNWSNAVSVDVTGRLRVGANELSIDCKNEGGPAGLLARLEVDDGMGLASALVTDSTWRMDGGAARSFGPRSAPDGPWPDPFVEKTATAVTSIEVLPGFKVELVKSAQAGEGSWINMTFDPQGRLVIGREEGGLVRVDVSDVRRPRTELFAELFNGKPQGLLFAHGGLFVNVNGSKKHGGLWFWTDTDGDDVLDARERWFEWEGGGEHGAHGVVLGPDGALWLIHGNMATRPDFTETSPHQGWAEDVLLPRAWDPNGHARATMAPGSHVLRIDADRNVEIWAAGMRNAYDLAFSPDGELFTYDSDMEWDVGLPWYRPTRIIHLVKGGEYGWRSGSGKWPDHYLDSLPAAVDIGRGSPTGVCFGDGARFQQKYVNAFFAADWSEGRILAVHLERDGASYCGSFEEFATGTPLNVTDLEIGPDGALWFTTGGRGTQSGLYRIAATAEHPRGVAQRSSSGEMGTEWWSRLGSPDRTTRYAARVELEAEDPSSWKERALAETDVDTSLSALVAGIRTGATGMDAVVLSLSQRPFGGLERRQQLDELRVAALSLIRGGFPDEASRTTMIARYGDRFPTGDAILDRELYGLLLTIDAPHVERLGLDAIGSDMPMLERFFYAFTLRDRVPFFDAAGRERYIEFLLAADAQGGGNSFAGYVDDMRERLPFEDRKRSTKAEKPPPSLATNRREKTWTRAELLPELKKVSRNRDYARGIAAYETALCGRCHRFDGKGGNGVAPDLTAIASRFTREDLLDSLLDPSKVVSDQYQNSEFSLVDGRIITGRVLKEDGRKITVRKDALTGARIEVDRRELLSRRPSMASPMPPALLDRLTLPQILDLMALLESRGDPEHSAFRD